MPDPTDEDVIQHLIHGDADDETAEKVDTLVESLIDTRP